MKNFLKNREYLIYKFYERLEQIGRKNIVVEIDEYIFDQIKYNRGYGVDDVWALGMVKKNSWKTHNIIAYNRYKYNNAYATLKKHINSESGIYSDYFKNHTNLNRNFKNHNTVNHSLWLVNPIFGVNTNTFEQNWADVKIIYWLEKESKKYITLNLRKYMLKMNPPVDT